MDPSGREGTGVGSTREALETALREREQELSAVFDTVSDVVFQLGVEPDGRFRFLSVNRAFLAATGLSAPQVVGKSVEEVIPEPACSFVLGSYRRALSERRPVSWEETSEYPSGTKVGIVTMTPIFDTAKAGTRLLGIVQDVTEKKNLEKRTAELAVAKERAESADRLKSAFLATMSHELRTPLNSIIGFSGVLLQGLAGPLNDEQKTQLGMVQVSAEHLLALINDVLDISKIEAGQLTLLVEPFDVQTSLEKVYRTTLPLAERKGLALTLDVAPDVGAIASDRRRVEQVVLNLLGNAVKFTERGSVYLVCDRQGDTLRIRVTDTGIGIKPADLPRLFHPFQQIDGGTTRQYEGTGLGLSICKKLTALLGGTIRVESEWGKGSTFEVTIVSQGRTA